MAFPTVRGGKSQGVAVSEEVFDKVRVTGDSQIGSTAAALVGFHGVAGADQAAVITSVDATDVTQTSAFGWSTSAKAWAATTAIDAIIAALKEKGIVALA